MVCRKRKKERLSLTKEMSLCMVIEPKSELPSWIYEHFNVAKKNLLEKVDMLTFGIR